MYMIAGLGNPGKEYNNTRHNIGFAFIDALAQEYDINVMDVKLKALTGKGMIGGQKVLLVKPLTFMNLSGESIRPLADYYKVDPESELIVVKMGSPMPDGFPRTTELMQAMDYVVRKALEFRMPVAINLSFGNTYGSHDGRSLVERYILMICRISGRV